MAARASPLLVLIAAAAPLFVGSCSGEPPPHMSTDAGVPLPRPPVRELFDPTVACDPPAPSPHVWPSPPPGDVPRVLFAKDPRADPELSAELDPYFPRMGYLASPVPTTERADGAIAFLVLDVMVVIDPFGAPLASVRFPPEITSTMPVSAAGGELLLARGDRSLRFLVTSSTASAARYTQVDVTTAEYARTSGAAMPAVQRGGRVVFVAADGALVEACASGAVRWRVRYDAPEDSAAARFQRRSPAFITEDNEILLADNQADVFRLSADGELLGRASDTESDFANVMRVPIAYEPGCGLYLSGQDPTTGHEFVERRDTRLRLVAGWPVQTRAYANALATIVMPDCGVLVPFYEPGATVESGYVRIDADGSVQWTRELLPGRPGTPIGRPSIPLADGGLLVVAGCDVPGIDCLFHLDRDLARVWDWTPPLGVCAPDPTESGTLARNGVLYYAACGAIVAVVTGLVPAPFGSMASGLDSRRANSASW